MSIAFAQPLHKFARRLLWLAAALIAISGLAVAIALNYANGQAHVAGDSLIQSYSRIVQEEADRTLQNVDLHLQLAEADMQHMQAGNTLTEASAHEMLKKKADEMPYVRAMWVLDGKGRIKFDSDEGNIGANLSDRDYFRIFESQPETRVYLGTPVRSRFNKNWVITVSRPLFNKDGSFGGVVVAALVPGYFETLWAQLNLGDQGSVSLFKSDSVLMFRSPAYEEGMGKSFPNLPYFQLPPHQRQEGSFDNPSPLDGVHRHFAYRKLSQFEAVVVVGMTHDTILTQWRKMATIVVILWAMGAIVTTVLSLYLARDISLRFKAEGALGDSERRWRFALEGAGDGVWDWNVPSKTVFSSERCSEMFGYRPGEIGPSTQEWLALVHPDEVAHTSSELDALARGQITIYRNELRVRCKNGSYKWILARGIGVERSASGKALRVVGTYTDITERKLAQDALKNSLDEKIALLHEVHHRVKNNLQVVSSLLRLEAGRSAQPDTKAVLTEMQGRVRSMALLHESLYRTGIFATVDLGSYLKNLATQAFRAMASSSTHIRLVLDVDPISVNMDLATPCGLLVNELISNCFKHGFEGGQAGEVRIELKHVPNSGLIRLRVSDTGVGLPDDFDARRSTSLGLHLVSDLARQMGGQLDVGPGATFEVVFPGEVQKSQPAELH